MALVSILLAIAALGSSGVTCDLTPRDPNATAPLDPDGLAASVVSPPDVFEATPVTLSVEAFGATPPYTYRWTQNDGPADVTLQNDQTDTVTTDPITTTGRYVFKVVVTDSSGIYVNGFGFVNVQPLADLTTPDFVIVGQSATLIADLSTAPAGTTVLWTVSKGSPSLVNPNSATATLTSFKGETIELRVDITPPSDAGQANPSTKNVTIVSVPSTKPDVFISTTMGDFTIELNGDAAPLHMVNFLKYVDAGFYNGLLIHRVACVQNFNTQTCNPFVIQTGGVKRVDGELTELDPLFDPVKSEANNGLTNGTLYSVTTALSNGPNTGQNQFFINMDDNHFLDAQGFTVFGLVIDGTSVVDAISKVPVQENPLLNNEKSLPVDDIVVNSMTRVK
ncbi:MAG: peptidylprolyl isomerase [Planctomycetes bacterium]|nr:peptidylprolyl isomerase [Planctomycetota bacterium]MBI3833026.1 peptidylprolyl isomerase [Planctomycetota bacterium]